MHGTLASAALLGLSAFTAAAPTRIYSRGSNTSSSSSSSSGSSSGDSGEKAFSFPLANGFPNIANPSAPLTGIQLEAQGTLPNTSAPPPPKTDSLISLGFIAFNELFEVAFFTELIQNITNNVPGYDKIDDRDEVLSILKIVQAQEELHELNANGAFNKFTGKTIEPCEYIFPVDNFKDAIALAATFTDVVLGTLPDIQTIFATDGDNGLIRGVGSVIGQEGEQNGFYRQLLGKVPSALPFLTGSARDFAFSAINQQFVVPGSCPSVGLLSPPLTIFGVLTVETDPDDISSAQNSEVEFSISAPPATSSSDSSSASRSHSKRDSDESIKGSHEHGQDMEGLFLTYINQQNVPFSEPLVNVQLKDGTVTFNAAFPGKTQEMNGLTIAAVTHGDGPFATPDDVAKATIFGPGLIEVN